MARKITMFELHLDGIRFGRGAAPDSPETPEITEDAPELDDDVDPADEMDRAETTSGSRTRKIATVIGTVGLGWMVGRRVLRRLREDVEVGRGSGGEFDAESTERDAESAKVTAER